MSAAARVAGPRRFSGAWEGLARLLVLAALLFVFLLGVHGLGEGFKLLGRDVLDAFFEATENPFIALMVGLLATTLVQSSSLTTSMIVGMVAAPENALPLTNAVPMVMGANIGTTVTNTMVSLAHLARKDEFRRAFSVAICHDFFNFMTVAILLPLELLTGYLQHTAEFVASFAGGLTGVDYDSPLKAALKAAFAPVKAFSETLFSIELSQGVFIILLSGVLIFFALYSLVRLLRQLMESRVEAFLTHVLGRSALLSIAIGMMITVMVQSSSITTSLLVPLAGAGLITLEHAFPITIGANIGTTLTALLASLAVAGPNAAAGVVIALVHLGFNVSGTVLVYPVRAIRRIPLEGSRRVAEYALRSRRWAVIYILLLFYGIPAVFALLNRYLF